MITAIVQNTLDVGAPIIDAGTSDGSSDNSILENGKVNVSADISNLICTDYLDLLDTLENCLPFKKPAGVKKQDFDYTPLNDCKSGNDAIMDLYNYCKKASKENRGQEVKDLNAEHKQEKKDMKAEHKQEAKDLESVFKGERSELNAEQKEERDTLKEE